MVATTSFWARLRLAGNLGLLVGLTACTSSYHVDETAGESLILKAKERVVLTKKHGRESVVCAEPYPDLGSAMDVDAGLSAGAELPTAAGLPVPAPGPVQGNVEATLSTVETLMSLGTRTAGVNVLRDFAYRACEAYLNRAITPEEYELILLGSGYTIAAVLALDGMRGMDQANAPEEMRQIVDRLADVAELKMAGKSIPLDVRPAGG